MAKISNIKPAYFLGTMITNPKVLGGKVADMITAMTEKKTVTQLTSISTGVSLNAQSGVITTFALTPNPLRIRSIKISEWSLSIPEIIFYSNSSTVFTWKDGSSCANRYKVRPIFSCCVLVFG